MNSFWTAWSFSVCFVLLMPLASFAQHEQEQDIGGVVIRDGRRHGFPVIGAGAIFVPDADWKKTAFVDLWNATWTSDSEIRFLITQVCFNDESTAIVAQWLVDLGIHPPKHGPSLRPEIRPPADIDDSTIPFYSGKLKQITKTGHLSPALIELTLIVQDDREKLEKAYALYLTDGEKTSAFARSVLVQMAGLVAVRQLDRIIAEHSCPYKVGHPLPPLIDAGTHRLPHPIAVGKFCI